MVIMEHKYIDEHQIAENYLIGKLPAEERLRFEDHFVDCRECVDRLETANDLRAGLRMVAAEGAVQVGLLPWIVRVFRRRQALLLTGLILLIGLSATFLIKEMRSARRDPANEMQVREGQSLARQETLAPTLESRQPTPSSTLPHSDKGAGTEAPTPVFALSVVRGGKPDLSKPTNRIRLSPSSGLIILRLEVEPDPGIQSYRATISTPEGRRIWSRNNLLPTPNNKLAIRINSSLLKPENYLLTLDGLTPNEGYALIANYTFHVLPSK